MTRDTSKPGPVWAVLRRALVATKWMLAGMGTSMLAVLGWALVVLIAGLSLLGVGLLLLRPALLVIRRIADLERARLNRMGKPVTASYAELPYPPLQVLRALAEDPSNRRDLAWLVLHGSYGFLLASLALQAPVNVLRELSFPLWWTLVPPEESNALNGFIDISTWTGAWLVFATAPLWFILWLVVTPLLTGPQALPGVRLLNPHPDIDLSARLAQLTATRAAALDAHAVELRRIERALHDGAQNRLVGVAVLVGAARQALRRDPDHADAVLERAQSTAEDALAELRSVVRSILPPVLENRGLSGALSALAADSPVPCHLQVDVPVRCPVSVEATAYFAVAEALTNAAKHSRATRVDITVVRVGDRLTATVTDDGTGGAEPDTGTGLSGIRRRVAAHDGTTTITSPPGGPTVIEVELPCGS
ncbi:sensor histidine kinase [Stackebrandtia nassauensis]|uniref:histidine kinase n=1 Tax=Stackebrandtia nassauensis (strain DSM 44728 / CIP 108903 / NRRL B-16338 / NBRC 102104 / LLR-40K-21) TaxID=446470 RepID=D3Q272_STANL|nr:histidine kinase [Stackebrandtia nassauensis DSM 44728]